MSFHNANYLTHLLNIHFVHLTSIAQLFLPLQLQPHVFSEGFKSCCLYARLVKSKAWRKMFYASLYISWFDLTGRDS